MNWNLVFGDVIETGAMVSIHYSKTSHADVDFSIYNAGMTLYTLRNRFMTF